MYNKPFLRIFRQRGPFGAIYVDAFSWYRQRRKTPPGRPAPLPTDIRIPLMPTPTVSFLVFCRFPTSASIPSEEEAEDCLWNWLADHAPEPLRKAIVAFCEQGLMNLELHDIENVPTPPDALLRAFNPGEIEERHYREANYQVLIEAHDLLIPPRVGLWAAIAAARALSGWLPGGVILDPEFPRLLPRTQANEPLPDDGYIRVIDHILIPYSHTPNSGLLWMTTKGMGRFGLPDLELKEVPPNLATALMPVVNGVAQKLMEASLHHAQEVGPSGGFERAGVLPVKAELTLTLENIRRAYARSEEEVQTMEAEDAEVAAVDTFGETRIRLGISGGNRRHPPLIRLLPPSANNEESGVWIHRVLTDLFGSDPQMAMVEMGDEEMEEAHQRAISELPLVRSRFQAGFQSGEVLHVKHGFPTENDSHEYIWIAVTGWRDGRIYGRLTNDPQYLTNLHAGQSVEIGEDEVYDWLIVHTDGRLEGAYTNQLLEE